MKKSRQTSVPLPRIHATEEPEPCVLVHGDLDFRAAVEFSRAVTALLERHEAVVVDLSGSPFVDSSGVGALLDAHKLATRTRKRVELRGPRAQVRKALQISGFASLFGVEPLRLETTDPSAASPEALQTDWRINESVVVGIPILVASMREEAVEAAREAGLSESALHDVRLAVGEALTNALKHAVRPGLDKIRVRCMTCPSAFVVEVTDQGAGFNPDSVSIPEAASLQAGGLGIHLMRSSMDEVEFASDGRGSKVRMIKWIGAPGDKP